MKTKNKSGLEFAAIILAAGRGKRMKSKQPKVLHQIAGKPMLKRTLEVVSNTRPSQIIVVVNGSNITLVKKTVGKNYTFAIQKEPLGTADAARSGLEKALANIQDVAVLYGDDTAFYKKETIAKVFAHHRKTRAQITFVTLLKTNPQGFGRIVRRSGKLVAIVEEKDASPRERNIKEINDGLYFFNKNWLSKNLPKLSPSPATAEYYLTDLIKIALAAGAKVETYQLKDPRQWHGINTPEELEEANRKQSRRIHIMGLAGAGASAVAGIANAYGFEVSGCDIAPQSAYSKSLGIKIQKGHSPNHLGSIDLLVISPAITKLNPNSPEILKAKKLKIPILSWQEFQGKYLQPNKFVIAVTGAYGKSTTTAMISQMLIDAGLDPTCEIGAKVLSWDKNFRVGKSKYFVCEADEYNDNFLNYNPDVAVVLNIAWEHPDFFKSEKDVIASYQKFINKIKPDGTLIISKQALSFFEQSEKSNSSRSARTIRGDTQIIQIADANVRLSLIGDFRKENAAAALSVAKALNLDFQKAKKSVEKLTGLGRRLELKGEIKGVKVYDDYAVQPYTVQTTADALKEKFKDKKVLLVFEPHTFSRIETFFGGFVDALKNSSVDKIYITEVFAAREKGNRIALAQKLAKSVGDKAKFTGSLQDTVAFIDKNMHDFDIVLSMGAGDVYKLYDLIKTHNRVAPLKDY